LTNTFVHCARHITVLLKAYSTVCLLSAAVVQWTVTRLTQFLFLLSYDNMS